jgi:hypothetical protein
VALRYVKLGWFVVVIIVLLVTMYFFDGEPNSDVDIFLIWSMLVLSFPISIVCALILSGITYVIYKVAGITVPTTYLSMLLFWLVFFVAGYWQWFVLGPRVTRMFRKKESDYR